MQGEQNYLELLADVRKNGTRSGDRTGVGTFKVFGRSWECDDVGQGFPLLTTKRVHFKSVVGELLWFLTGSTNVKDLHHLGCTIWDEWADSETGDLGPGYGFQWRRWPMDSRDTRCAYVDQLANAVAELRNNPDSRRCVVSAWNAAMLRDMALPPCHFAFQLATNQGDLNMAVSMRSIDIFLGLPFNIASYALLLKMFAQVLGFKAKRLYFSLGDLHIYNNHLEQVDTQLARTPFLSPVVTLEPSVTCLENFSFETIQLTSYKCHPKISAPVAV